MIDIAIVVGVIVFLVLLERNLFPKRECKRRKDGYVVHQFKDTSTNTDFCICGIAQYSYLTHSIPRTK